MIRFQCPLCRGIIAAESWTPNEIMTCACCGKEVKAPESHFSPGAVLGDFLLVKKLGAGGMGIVFLAHQLSLDRPAAIKILNPEYSKEGDSVQAFIREARSAAKLNHPNIVQAYAVGEDDGIFYFAMEYIDGETMKETLQRQGKIEFKEAANAVMQVADALDTAWREQKLIHHDIKPDNIMHCSNQRYKLADLGLSQVFGEDADDDSDEVLGTPQYISPEQLTGVVTDTRSDIYSLGATFYHLVTGQFPYNGKNTDEIARQHVFGTLVPPNKVNPLLPKELNDIIVRMMEKDPAKRYQDCGEVVKAIRDFLNPSKRSGGLSGNGGLGGGLSGNSGGGLRLENNAAKARTIMPPGHSKISLTPAAAPQVAVPEAKPAAAVTIAPSAKPIKLSIKSPAAPPPAEKPVPAPEPAPEPAPAPAEKPKAKLLTKPVPVSAPVPVEPPEKAEAPAAVQAETPAPVEVPPEKSETADAATPAGAEPVAGEGNAAQKRGHAGLWLLLIAVIVLLGGGAGYYCFLRETPAPAKVPVKTPSATPKPAPQTAPPTEIAGIPDVTIREYAAGAPVAPPPKAEPVKTPWERLADLAMSDPARFLREWPGTSRSLSAATDKERQALAELEITYINLDEKRNVLPAREPLLKAYEKSVATKIQREKEAARAARIAEEDKRAEEQAAESAANYHADLKRRVMLLDHAMIRAARSGKEDDWRKFTELVNAARREPALYARDAQRKETAEMLALYASELSTAANQGRAFTAFLASGKANGRKFTVGKLTVAISKTTKDSITCSVTGEGTEADSGTFHFRTDSPVKARMVVDAVGSAAGRSHQFFYYMVYNGFLKEDLSFAAPSTFWKQSVGHIANNYFRRAIFIAAPQELEALRKEFGSWRSFQWAEKHQP